MGGPLLIYTSEAAYTNAIHRALAKHTAEDVDIWKIHDTFAGGVPDAVYFGRGSTLWVEYKYLKTLPKRETTAIDITKELSDNQQKWLERKHNLGHRTWVIVGTPKGSLILKSMEWQTPLYAKDMEQALTIKQVTASIIEQLRP